MLLVAKKRLSGKLYFKSNYKPQIHSHFFLTMECKQYHYTRLILKTTICEMLQTLEWLEKHDHSMVCCSCRRFLRRKLAKINKSLDNT